MGLIKKSFWMMVVFQWHYCTVQAFAFGSAGSTLCTILLLFLNGPVIKQHLMLRKLTASNVNVNACILMAFWISHLSFTS